MNPILPMQHFVPDGEARLMPDGRLYLYGSYDLPGENTYCSEVLHVFSTLDMIEWTDHGICLKSSDIPWAKKGALMYAPDCIFKDGKYYLYFCMTNAYEGVAVSDTPYGYFQNPVQIAYADGDSIDPAIFLDDDGQAYYFWGQFHLNGAKMNSDMHTLDLTSLNTSILDEKRHGFHEGACMRKRGNIYYLIYTDSSRGRATCLSYAMSHSPLGPFKKGGVIIDNIWCDPETWNNHGSIECFHDQWYVFYHRSSQNSKYNRRMCAEPITFDDAGRIREVCMTSSGCEDSLPAVGTISTGIACEMRNGPYITPLAIGDNYLESGICEILTHVTDGSFAVYRYLNFSSPKTFMLTAGALANGGTVTLWADDEIIGSCKVTPTGGWNKFQTFTCDVKPISGKKTLYLVFKGNDLARRLMDIKEFRFV